MDKLAHKAKSLIENLRPIQEDSKVIPFPCPRCGHDRMNRDIIKNALSRYVDVYICNQCGRDEAVRDLANLAPLPFKDWGMVKGMWR
ncbi:MAG: hypothetical protein FH749_07980 [Firmicutes bacterium]|nr:hypothetical protein [Bacillota bacterium]